MRIIAILMSAFIAFSSTFSTPFDTIDKSVNKAIDTTKNVFNKISDTIGDVMDTTVTSIDNAFKSLGIKDYTYNPSSDKFVNSPRLLDNYTYSNDINDYSVNYYTTNNNYTNKNDITVPISYNTVNNNYRFEMPNYNYTTNNVYNTDNYYYSYDIDNNLFYSVTNNETNIVYTTYNYVTYDYDVYVCYFMTPNGQNSYNLTVEDVHGVIFSYDVYNYVEVADSDDVIALFTFDNTFNNTVPYSNVTINYGSRNFIDGKYDGALKLDSTTTDLALNFTPTSDYTLEFDFYNAVPNYDLLTPNAWTHCVYYYDISEDSWRVFFNGVESNHGTYINPSYYPLIKTNYSPYAYYYSYGSTALNNFNRNPIAPSKFRYNYCSPYTFNSTGSTTLSSYADTKSLITTVNNYRYRDILDFKLGTSQSVLDLTEHVTYTRDTSWINCYDINSDSTIFHSSPYLDSNGIHFYGTSYRTDSNIIIPTTNITIGYDNSVVSYVNYHNFGSQSTSYTTLGLDYYNLTLSPTLTYDFSMSESVGFNGFDMRNCAIDNMRITKGHIYGENMESYIAPTAPFTLGFIYVAPLGSFNNGDIAILSSVDVNRLRVGGALFSVPHVGDVYIQLNENGTSYYALQYYDGQWNECDFSVWNGLRWQSGYDYNFYSNSFNDTTLTNGGNTYNIYIDNSYLDISNNEFNYNYDNDTYSPIDSFNAIKVFLLGIVSWVTSTVTLFTFLPIWVSGLFIAVVVLSVPIAIVLLVKKLLF